MHVLMRCKRMFKMVLDSSKVEVAAAGAEQWSESTVLLLGMQVLLSQLLFVVCYCL